MAKYAQGYARKNSDTKNLIIMASMIVFLILISLTFVILYNKFWKKAADTYASEEYASYYLSNYSELLNQDEVNYLIYVCSSSSEEGDDSNMTAVLNYIDEYIAGDVSIKLYLLDYDKFDSTSDKDETANADGIKAELGISVSEGYLIAVQNNKLVNTAKQVITKTATVIEKLELLEDGGELLNFNAE